MSPGGTADPVEEARRIISTADGAGIAIRAVGGVAVALRAPSISTLSPPRTYHDLDLAAAGGRSREIAALFDDLGYEAADRFNKLNGSERLLFHDSVGRRVDVFIDRLRMCHTLDFADRVGLEPLTLPLADLVLSKIQIVEMTPRDAQDLLALLADHPVSPPGAGGIDVARITSVCAVDWGWWRTTTGNLGRLRAEWRANGSPIASLAAERAGQLLKAVDESPKGAGWRARAWLGDRKRWYELPEEVR